MSEQQLVPMKGNGTLIIPLGLDGHAQRIRDLVNVTRGMIIEIGRELIEAKRKCGDAEGEWQSWLDREFGWSQPTASRYMQVAEAFQLFRVNNRTENLTIDASALYTLAAPDAPQAARDEAIGRGEKGERITKAEAQRMIERANADIEDRAREAIEAERAQAADRMNAAIRQATAELADDNARLQVEIKRIQATAAKPDVASIAENLCRTTGRKKLGDDQYRLLAQLLNKRIAVGKRAFDPISAEQLKANEEKLRIATMITQALETLAGAPPADAMRGITWPVQRKQHRRLIDFVQQWVTTYQADLLEDDNGAQGESEAKDGTGGVVEGPRRASRKADQGKRRQAAE